MVFLRRRYRGRLSHNLRAIELLRQVGGEPVLLGQALTQTGASTTRYGDVAEAEQYFDEALSVLRRCGRTKRLARHCLLLAASRKDAGDLQAARALVEEAEALSKAFGDVRRHDYCEVCLAMIAFDGRPNGGSHRPREARSRGVPACMAPWGLSSWPCTRWPPF